MTDGEVNLKSETYLAKSCSDEPIWNQQTIFYSFLLVSSLTERHRVDADKKCALEKSFNSTFSVFALD